jgi:predicted glycoside hydrolase/deacetylase ChbG (UPF0249 family)
MPPRLIINADDFGLTTGINRAVAELHRANALTSATLMATGPAFDDAVAIARANPTLGVGCHIVLTDGTPVSPPQSIPTLLGPDGKTFRPSLIDFVQALLRGRIREEDIEREATAQIEKLQQARLNVTHLDTHKHTHLFPAVARPLLRVAERCSIKSIRSPFEPAWCNHLKHGALRRRLQMHLLNRFRPHFYRIAQIRNHSIVTTNGTVAISATGSLTATTLQEVLDALPTDGTYELCCHPGYNNADLDAIPTRLRATRDIEREALLALIPKLSAQPNAPTLINYGDLSPNGVTHTLTNTGHERVR